MAGEVREFWELLLQAPAAGAEGGSWAGSWVGSG